jgi:hypothetical protein
MATGVVGFRPVESVPNVLAALAATGHNGFPVAMPPEPVSGSNGAGTGLRAHHHHQHGVGVGSYSSLVSLAALANATAAAAPVVDGGGAAAAAAASGLDESPTNAAAPATAASAASPHHGIPQQPPPGVGGVPAGSVVCVEGGRLEGVVLRSQLLVLLQRRHFCDAHGRPVGREYCERREIELEVR